MARDMEEDFYNIASFVYGNLVFENGHGHAVEMDEAGVFLRVERGGGVLSFA